MAIFWVIAGPNGVGKTTYAFRNLQRTAQTINFVNLDEIARGLSPLDPAAAERDAARIALERARNFIRDGVTFAMETTLSGQTHFLLADEAHAHGMQVNLHYFSVPDVAICIERIARRVSEGGHDVPEAMVKRRYERSHANLVAFTRKSDFWRIFSGLVLPPRVALQGSGAHVGFHDDDVLGLCEKRIQAFVDL